LKPFDDGGFNLFEFPPRLRLNPYSLKGIWLAGF
jgi:hypothetical protein